MKTILVTGSAGFIGSSLVKKLKLHNDYKIVGVDNLNNYYDVSLKKTRLSLNNDVTFIKSDISNIEEMNRIFEDYNFDIVINLAAQAGVRYARKNPDSYIDTNIIGFYNILSLSAKYNVDKVLYASSSSVYGDSTEMPFKESNATQTPMSIYAATKCANEALASAYYYSHNLKSVGMRFFNVYGPWGRPDMAYFDWTKKLIEGSEVTIRDDGEMWRDMTYIDDVVRVIEKLIDIDGVGREIVNVGNRAPVKIGDMLDYLAMKINVKPLLKNEERGAEEPVKTWSDTTYLHELINYSPDTDYRYGLDMFIEWYKSYYEI